MRRRIGMIVFLAMGLAMAGCGYGGPGSGNINGSWTASLTNADGSIAYQFSATFTQDTDGALGVSNFTFTSAGPCFASDQTSETGTFNFMGNLNGKVTGSFGLTVTPMFPGATNSVLTLNGTVNGNTISGIWTLGGGAGCRGSGTFIIQPPTAGGQPSGASL
jgi:predicted lipoprotein with Yx(FWY)xxD motif